MWIPINVIEEVDRLLAWILKEVNRLLEAIAIKEVQYLTWLANTVVVKKNGKWRVCVDYTNLNDACPKDCFPLPKIDQLMDVSAGYARLSFMDAYQGYKQTTMHRPDREKIAFNNLHPFHAVYITRLGFCINTHPLRCNNFHVLTTRQQLLRLSILISTIYLT